MEPEELSSGYLKLSILELAPAEFYFRRHSDLMPYAHIVHLFPDKHFWYSSSSLITTPIKFLFMAVSLHFPILDFATLYYVVSLLKLPLMY